MTPPHDSPAAAAGVAERAALRDVLGGFLRTQAIAVAAELGVADVVGDRPIAVDELASRVGAHGPSLYRLLRLLASLGIFAETEPRAFVRTSLSDGLRSDAALSVRHFAMLFAGDAYLAAGHMLDAICTGAPVAEQVFGRPFFEHLAEDPAAGETFTRAMGGGAGARASAALRHTWTDHATVVDIGGGDGSLLIGLLGAHRHLRGIVFDMPHVAGAARAVIDTAGLSGRCEVVSGDFFADRIPPADVHVLSQILHDWDDQRAGEILRNSRASISSAGRLLVIEQVVPDGDGPSFSKELDLLMLVLLGGKERSEQEWRTLLKTGGFQLTAITPAAGTNLIEAAPV
jgi:hypothetical protein